MNFIKVCLGYKAQVCLFLAIIICQIIFCTSHITCISAFSFHRESSEIEFIINNNLHKQEEMIEESMQKTQEEKKSKTSIIKSIALNLIKGYQRFFSSQDRPVCNFIPSCSRFGAYAIKRYGFAKGFLLSSDRLQRCHPFAKKYYKLDFKTQKVLDSVEDYSLKHNH